MSDQERLHLDPSRSDGTATTDLDRCSLRVHGSPWCGRDAIAPQATLLDFQSVQRDSRFPQDVRAVPTCEGGRIIQRPHSQLWHARQPNEGLHFDYLYLGKALAGPKYVLVLKDDLSHFCELVASDEASADVVVEATLRWASRFSMPMVWISDQGTHFKNYVMEAVARHLKVHHQFVVTYTPWRNGTVERLNRDLLQVMRVMLREYGLALDQWEYLLPVVQANLNQTPVASLEGKTPMDVFTGYVPVTALITVVADDDEQLLRQVNWSQPELTRNMKNVQASMAGLHKAIVDKRAAVTARREAARTHMEHFIANVGDYVLWSRVDEKRYPKLLVTWLGPYKIVEVTMYSCTIKHIITGIERQVHTSRLKPFAESSYNITEEIREHVSQQAVSLKIREISDVRYDRSLRQWEICCLWEGLEDIESSWERFKSIATDAPAVAKKFAKDVKDQRIKEGLLQELEELGQSRQL